MLSFIYLIIGTIIAAFFFQLTHIASIKSVKEIEDASKKTTNIRYVILSWLIKNSRVEIVDEFNSDKEEYIYKENVINDKHFYAKTLKERNIQFSILPFMHSVYGFFLISFYVALFTFFPILILSSKLVSLGFSDIHAAIILIPFVIYPLGLLTLADGNSLYKLIIIDDKFTIYINDSIIYSKLKNIKITPDIKFVKLLAQSDIPGFKWISLEGIALFMNNEKILITEQPTFLIKWFGYKNKDTVDTLVKKLNHEITNISKVIS